MADKSEIEDAYHNVTIPKGSRIITPDQEGDYGDFFESLIEFLATPEFVEKILPVFSEHLQRRHKEVMEKLTKDFKETQLKTRFNLYFLIARVFIGLALVGAVTTLTVHGKIETETTIVMMMVTLGVIIWGSKD
jgi:uncharacterized Tic20 family protein